MEPPEPRGLRVAARKDLERHGTVKFENTEVRTIESMHNGMFKVHNYDGKGRTERKVIPATGVKDVFSDIPGYAEYWITGM